MQSIAEELAREQKEISISEFFEKNRHLLGYDNKARALLMIVKEACDNALDVCEEAKILPEIYVKTEEIEKEKYKIIIRDNGPGIVKKQIPKIFGKLLYGSKFHKLKQNRGQQGIGISVAVLYSQLTTGLPVTVLSSTGDGKTHKYKLKIDVKHNEPKILKEEISEGKEWHGVQVSFVAEGLYREHKQSVLEYLKQVAIANPYAHIIFDSPNGRIEFQRGSDKLPAEPKEIKPHLHGVELGVLARMLHSTKARTLLTFLTTEFTRTGKLSATQIIEKAGITYYNEKLKKDELGTKISPRKITDEQINNLVKAIKVVKLTKPPTDCLSPLGKELIENGLKKELNPEFISVVSRSPEVYRGWPFQVECGIAYGGSITQPKIMRFANRVPLLYQQGDCAITKAMQEIDWRRYGLQIMEEEPVVILLHLCSVWVPFTSESKEAIASYPIIIKEIKLALQDCGRELQRYLAKKVRHAIEQRKREMFKNYAIEVADSLAKLSDKSKENILKRILDMAESIYKAGKIEEEVKIVEEGDKNDKKRV